MFDECSSLNELNIFNFNTQNVTNVSSMFSDCLLLKDWILLDLKLIM